MEWEDDDNSTLASDEDCCKEILNNSHYVVQGAHKVVEVYLHIVQSQSSTNECPQKAAKRGMLRGEVHATPNSLGKRKAPGDLDDSAASKHLKCHGAMIWDESKNVLTGAQASTHTHQQANASPVVCTTGQVFL